ncbi:hypothetical protein OIB37_02430 [Streptomyces sp. NBC_00820]|uniref:hypothetical protein n=1 Tax=Streptomyces sp. NBC_00820 TaxID=2975842 RepID=UPI002ED01563|nr:hypothetical protein OIB37_02430 [Streptomyces sp. NBC_00820]
MSGPMALEPGGAEGDTLALRLAGPPARHRRGDDHTLALRLPGQAAGEEVSRLAAELADRIGPAVHPYEVAALLEAEGLTADVIGQRYGHPDLFSLATALYEQVPRTFPEPAPTADPWRPDTVRCLLRGVLFALPGLAYLLTAPLWHPGRHAAGLIVAGLVSWAWGQALGHRAHLRMATGRREAAGTLLAGAPLGAALATAAAALSGAVLPWSVLRGIVLSGSAPRGSALPAGTGAALLAVAAQSLYLAAAGVLLVLARERLLLAALTPLIAGAAVLPWWEPGHALRAALALTALAATLAATGWALRTARTAPAVPDARRPGLPRSLPYGLFGLAAGLLVLLEGRREPYAVIVLTLSMGPAEWLLYRYRGLSVAALRAAATPAGFLLRSTGVLGLCLLAYLLPLLPAALLTGADPATLVLLAATLWTALLLQAFGAAWPPAVICLAAAATAAAALLLRQPPGTAALPLCCGAAELCLLLCVLRLLGRPARHA